MDRKSWLIQKRRIAEDRYDQLWAPIYDANWGATLDPLHQRYVTQLANSCPAEGYILDAACGTGKYWPILLASGRRFTAIDQSQQMLNHAMEKYPQVTTCKTGLQEIDFVDTFDLILCIDSMENVFPEDWPFVLENFYRALKTFGQLYFTVEIADPTVLEHDYQSGLALGLPLVYGELALPTAEGEESGYHYYPSMDQVRKWLKEASFIIKEEAEVDVYHHFWVEKGVQHAGY